MLEVFFLLFAAKLEQGIRDRDERFFFPLVTIAASPLNFRRKQQEKKPLTPRVLLSPLDGLFISSTFEGGGGVLIERGGLFSLAKQDAILPFKRPEDDINSPYKELKGYEV